MAENRTFTLIGKFDDRITPSLKGINASVDKLKDNFKTLGSISKSVSKNLRTFSDANKDLQSSFKTQSADIKNMVSSVRMLRTELGRLNRAYSAASKKQMRLPVVPAAPAPGRGRAPRGGGGGGGGFAAAVGGGVAGAQLGGMMTNAIVRGFQIGTSIMAMPLNNFASAMAERIQDEMSDITSAGAMFALDRKDNLNLFKSFGQARRAQEELNARLAKSAAELPGETAEYVQQAKKITDSMMIAMGKNQQAFQKFGEELGAKQGDKMDALGVVIQKFTEKAVLLGQGGPGGAGAAYGVPALLEQMLSKDQVNVEAMTAKYASLRSNPLLANALKAAEAEINATAVGSAERLKVIMKTLDNALPQEVIGAMRNSMDGIVQSIKSAFLDPEVGLFGYGRKLQGILVARRDELGRYLDKAGNIVDDISEAEMETTSLFGLIRDSLAGFVLPLGGLLEILPQLYDPLAGIGMSLTDFRELSQKVLLSFNEYTAWFKEQEGVLKETASARGGLAAFNNLLASLGVFSDAEFTKVGNMLKDPEANLGDIAKNIFTNLFNSDFMKQVGEVIGNMVGGAIAMVGNIMGGAADMATAGPFAEGLKAGWDNAGGSEGVKKVFSSLFSIIGNLLKDAFKAAPLEMSILTALTVGMPIITGVITAGITGLFTKLGTQLPKILKATKMKGLGLAASAIVSTGNMKGGAAAAKGGAAASKVGGKALTKGLAGLTAFGLKAGKVVKGVPFIGAAFGVADFLLRKNEGESTAQAAGGAIGGVAGGVAGAAIGSAILPGAGTVAGGMIGTLIGDWIGTNIGPALANLPAQLSAAWDGLVRWVQDLPFNIGYAISYAITSLAQAWDSLGQWFQGLGPKFAAWWEETKKGITSFITSAGAWLSSPSSWASLGEAIKGGVAGMLAGVKNNITNFFSNIGSGFQAGQESGKNAAKAKAVPKYKGGLGDAIASEMKHKPKGSDLVIANSSETVIPAAGGYGMKDFLDTLKLGFDQVLKDLSTLGHEVKITSEASRKRDEDQSRRTDALDNKITQQYEKTQNDILKLNQNMSALSKEVSKMSSMGGMPGGMGGAGMALGSGYGSGGGAIAGALGDYIKQTGGAPGSIHEHPAHGGVKGRHAPGSYHYSGRAIDIGAYAYEQAGVISRIQQFNQKMGVKPVEFLHAGNDGNHQDHVHVAYALGKGNPAFFSSQAAAERWEASMAGSMNVRSITGNTKEGFGGGTTIGSINVTVNGSNVNNVDELASIIALKLGDAIEDARAASIFV